MIAIVTSFAIRTTTIEEEPPIQIKSAVQDEQLNTEEKIKQIEEVKPIPQEIEKPKQTPIITKNINTNEVLEYAKTRNNIIFGEQHWSALHILWQKESGWQVGRANKEGACGIPQSLPCSKIYGFTPKTHYIQGKLFIVNPDYKKEIDWGLTYIQKRYGTPTKAWQVWQKQKWY